ncbi:hypothetical protein MASR2M15_04420 [Anaerolineales bacterium]
MYRNYTNRIFAGVCGGLAEFTPINSWIWRLLFILGTLLSGGSLALVYLMLWWLLPLAMPSNPRPLQLFPTLTAVILSVVILGLYFLRDQLLTPAGFSMAPALMLLLMAIAFLVSQLSKRQGGHTNSLWGWLGLVVAGVALGVSFGLIPQGWMDLILRASPIIVLFLGLAILLKTRVRYGNIIALILSLIIVGGIATLAYNLRASRPSTDQSLPYTQIIPATVQDLRLNIDTLDTDIRVQAGDADVIQILYTGALANELDLDWSEDGNGIATFTLTEKAPEGFPPLDALGRGSLTVCIPPDSFIALQLASDKGNVQLDLASTQLERVGVDMSDGDLFLSVPDYQPLSPSIAQSPSQLSVWSGNISLLLPKELGMELVLDRRFNRQPDFENFDEILYALENTPDGWLLKSRGFDSLSNQVRYLITAPEGVLQLNVETE